MFKKLVAALLALVAATAFAAVDVNKADAGRAGSRSRASARRISSKILDERKKGAFKDWNDLIDARQGRRRRQRRQVLEATA